MKTFFPLLIALAFAVVSTDGMAQPKAPPQAQKEERKAPAPKPKSAVTDTAQPPMGSKPPGTATAQPVTTKKPKFQKDTPLASKLKPTKKKMCHDKCTASSPGGLGASAAYSMCMYQCMQQ